MDDKVNSFGQPLCRFVHLVDQIETVQEVKGGCWLSFKWFVDGDVEVS